MPRAASTRSGLVLLVVVGVLGVLVVLSVAFVTMARLERRASQQRLNATRALLLARSGLEDAMARLGAGQDPLAPGSRYGGEDWNADGSLNAGPQEQGGEVYRPGRLDTDTCPAAQAVRPSFFVMAGALPAVEGVDGRLRGYSGFLEGDLGSLGNRYALKVASGGVVTSGTAGRAWPDRLPPIRWPACGTWPNTAPLTMTWRRSPWRPASGPSSTRGR